MSIYSGSKKRSFTANRKYPPSPRFIALKRFKFFFFSFRGLKCERETREVRTQYYEFAIVAKSRVTRTRRISLPTNLMLSVVLKLSRRRQVVLVDDGFGSALGRDVRIVLRELATVHRVFGERRVARVILLFTIQYVLCTRVLYRRKS